VTAVKALLRTLTGRPWSDEGFATFVAAFVAVLFFTVMVQIQTLIQAEEPAAPSGIVYPIHAGP
jgi:hypothetical protein